MTRSVTGAQAIDRALSVLLCFSDQQSELGITDIARVLDLSPSTVHRIVKALTERGFLRQNLASDRYQLGQAMVVLGRRAQAAFDLDRVLPLLRELATVTGESVNLGVRDRDGVVVLLHVESSQALRFDHRPGSVVPLHASAMGKCLITWSRDPLASLEELGPLPKLTATTITTVGEWEREIERIREAGYSVDDEESVIGVRCVGAPVVEDNGTADIALAVLAPSVRMTHQAVRSVSAQVRDVAQRIRDTRIRSDVPPPDDSPLSMPATARRRLRDPA